MIVRGQKPWYSIPLDPDCKPDGIQYCLLEGSGVIGHHPTPFRQVGASVFTPMTRCYDCRHIDVGTPVCEFGNRATQRRLVLVLGSLRLKGRVLGQHLWSE